MKKRYLMREKPLIIKIATADSATFHTRDGKSTIPSRKKIETNKELIQPIYGQKIMAAEERVRIAREKQILQNTGV